jgi:hypothetical protein
MKKIKNFFFHQNILKYLMNALKQNLKQMEKNITQVLR